LSNRWNYSLHVVFDGARKYLRASYAFLQHFSLKWNNRIKFSGNVTFWNKFWHFQRKKLLLFRLRMNANYWTQKFKRTPFKIMYCRFIVLFKHISSATNDISLQWAEISNIWKQWVWITCIQHGGFNMAVILIKIIKNMSVLQIKLINTPYKSKNWKKYGQ